MDKPITCTRLIGKEGEKCATCGRVIVRYDYESGAYSLQHEGPSIGQRLHELDRERRAGR